MLATMEKGVEEVLGGSHEDGEVSVRKVTGHGQTGLFSVSGVRGLLQRTLALFVFIV